MPKPPPTSPAITRTAVSGTPSTDCASNWRMRWGTWVEARIVYRPSARENSPMAPRCSIGAAVSRLCDTSSRTTCEDAAIAASALASSPRWMVNATLSGAWSQIAVAPSANASSIVAAAASGS